MQQEVELRHQQVVREAEAARLRQLEERDAQLALLQAERQQLIEAMQQTAERTAEEQVGTCHKAQSLSP